MTTTDKTAENPGNCYLVKSIAAEIDRDCSSQNDQGNLIKVKIGRPIRMPPRNAAKVIRAACAIGATKIGVAQALGAGFGVFQRWLDENPELMEAFERGREEERHTLHNVLYLSATKANPDRDSLVAAMFLLKARHQYRDQGADEVQHNKVSITFALPGALRPEQFTIENDP